MNADNAVWEQIKAAEKRALAGVGGAVVLLVYAVVVIMELRELEAGAREEVRTFSWLISLYRAFGLTGVVVGFALVVGFFAFVGVIGFIERSTFIAQMDARAYEAAVRKERASTSSWSQGTDESGRIPTSTWIWLGVLVLLIAGTFFGVKSGFIR